MSLVEAEDLAVRYPVRGGVLGRPLGWIRAVDGVGLSVAAGETLGLVGESGSGKSTLGRALIALRRPDAGSVRFQGAEILGLDPAGLKQLRRKMQIVFQDPNASLDPRRTVGSSVRMGLDLHGIGARAERAERVAEMFRQVGLRPEHTARFPHEFSGGQRQRIGIARALILAPEFLVADEAVSALDVSVQAQILNLLKDLQARQNLAMLFISHNLAVVEHMADRIAVMYAGRIVEAAPRDALFADPRHPYTRALLASVPTPDPTRRTPPVPLPGEPPDPANLPGGCRFRTRCPMAAAQCAHAEPALAPVGPAHHAACHFA